MSAEIVPFPSIARPRPVKNALDLLAERMAPNATPSPEVEAAMADYRRRDRRPLMDLRDKLERYHAALTAEMQRPMDGPYGTNGCWGPNGRAPKIQDWIRQVEGIVKSSQRTPPRLSGAGAVNPTGEAGATSLPTHSSKRRAA